MTAHFAVLSEKNIAAICLTNIAGAPAESLLRGALQSEMDIAPDKKAAKYDDYTLSEADCKAITGVYKSNEGQTIKVYEKDKAIFVEIQGAQIPTQAVSSRAVTITMQGTDFLLQFKDGRLHFGFRQLLKSE